MSGKLASATIEPNGGVMFNAATGFEYAILPVEQKKPELTPEVLTAALRAFRAAKTQFMISEEEASRMIAQAVIEALPQ